MGWAPAPQLRSSSGLLQPLAQGGRTLLSVSMGLVPPPAPIGHQPPGVSPELSSSSGTQGAFLPHLPFFPHQHSLGPGSSQGPPSPSLLYPHGSASGAGWVRSWVLPHTTHRGSPDEQGASPCLPHHTCPRGRWGKGKGQSRARPGYSAERWEGSRESCVLSPVPQEGDEGITRPH